MSETTPEQVQRKGSDNTSNRTEASSYNDGLVAARQPEMAEWRQTVSSERAGANAASAQYLPNMSDTLSQLSSNAARGQHADAYRTGTGDAYRTQTGEAYPNQTIDKTGTQMGDDIRTPMGGDLRTQIGEAHRLGDITEQIPKDGGEKKGDLQERFSPEYQQQKEAANRLDDHIDPNMSDHDQDTMSDLHWAIASGDSAAFGKAIQQFKGDPAELARFTNELNRTLQETGSGVRLVTKGEHTLIMGMGDRAVQISTDGRASVRNVQQLPNGMVIYGGHDHTASPQEQMRNIGTQARIAVTLGSSMHAVPKQKWP